MSTFPDKALIAAILAETARRAALECGSDHPEDIARTMANAVEHGAVALWIAHRGLPS